MDTPNLIGGAWLAERYGLKLVNALAGQSRIGGRRRTAGVAHRDQKDGGREACGCSSSCTLRTIMAS